jgi:hypothetical protein
MHSTTAHADWLTGPWSSYFGCEKKKEVGEIAATSATTSLGALLGRHKLTDERAHAFIDAFAGARAATQTTPYVLSVARSPRSSALLRISMYVSGALVAYEQLACE